MRIFAVKMGNGQLEMLLMVMEVVTFTVPVMRQQTEVVIHPFTE